MYNKLITILSILASLYWLVMGVYHTFYDNYPEAAVALLWYFVCWLAVKDHNNA
jgi:hypothetical protein